MRKSAGKPRFGASDLLYEQVRIPPKDGLPKRILIENQNAGFGVDTVVPIVRVDPVTITQLHARAEIDMKKKL